MRKQKVYYGKHLDKRKKPKKGDLAFREGYLYIFDKKWKRVQTEKE